MATTQRQVVLAARPVGAPKPGDFALVERELPTLGDGQYRIENRFLSMDAGFRYWMNEGSDDEYMPSMPLGEAVRSLTLGRIVESRNERFAEGDLVLGRFAWEEFSTGDDSDFVAPIPDIDVPLNYHVGVLGGTGMTAYFGMTDIGRPEAGQTVLVSSAAGAVGVVAGQIAKIAGATVVGVTGADDKCARLTGEFGFDRTINYRTAGDLVSAIGAACPDGVDVYFDNVGGPMLEAAIENLAMHARVVLCGAVAAYNATEPVPGPANLFRLVTMRARMEGFMYTDQVDRYDEARKRLAGWLADGSLVNAEHRLTGIENAGVAFCDMFAGRNVGKTLVEL